MEILEWSFKIEETFVEWWERVVKDLKGVVVSMSI